MGETGLEDAGGRWGAGQPGQMGETGPEDAGGRWGATQPGQ